MLRRRYTDYHYVLVIFGVILLILAWHPKSPLATIGTDTTPPEIVNVYPSGTATNPTVVSPGSNLSIYMDVIENIGLNISQVTITANLTGYSKTIELYNTSTIITYPEGNASRFASVWYVPDEPGIKYKLYWYVMDVGGNENSTITYAITEAEAPVGFFTVNGYKIPESETLWLNTLKLTFGYWVVKYPDVVSAVRVKIFWKNNTLLDDISFNKMEDSYWEANYTLPQGDTYYIVEGYVETIAGKSYKQLSIYLNYAPPQEVTEVTVSTIYKITLTGMAAVAIYLGARGRPIKIIGRRKKRKR